MWDAARNLGAFDEDYAARFKGYCQGDYHRQEREVFQKYLLHDKLPVRFGALLGFVLIAFFAAWTVGPSFLSEGSLRGRNVAQALAGNNLAGDSVWLK